jgi:DNA polymerase-4
MWGVGPVAKARLAEEGIVTIGQLAKTPGHSLEQWLGQALGAKLNDLSWNRDPRQIKLHHRAHSVSAQSALGRKPATEDIIGPTLHHLADRVATRLRAKSRSGRTVTVRVRFADLRAITRSITLPAAISATGMLAEVAAELVRVALADHPQEKIISLLAIAVSHIDKNADLQWELPLELRDARSRPGTAKGVARWSADLAVDAIRERFGRQAVGYGSVVFRAAHLVPDDFRELAEKEL